MDDWYDGRSSWNDLMAERTLKTWDEFDAWVSERRSKRDKTMDTYIRGRKRGRVRGKATKRNRTSGTT